MRALEWVFAALAIWLAWRSAVELWLMWYSGTDVELSPTQWWLGVARVVLFTLVALLVVASEIVFRE